MNSKVFSKIAARAMFDARSTASYNPTLTNYATEVAAEIDISDALFLAPVIPVVTTKGNYKQYAQKDQIVIYNTARALGGQPNMIGLNATDAAYSCTPQALGSFVDDQERDDAPDAGSLLDEKKIGNVVRSARRSLLNRVIAKLRTSKAAHGTRGKWNLATVDPIKELNDTIVERAQATGLLMNRIWMDLSMWNTLINHKKVTDRMVGAEVAAANLLRIKSMLTANPGIEIKIGVGIGDTGNPGSNAASGNFIGAGSCFVFYAENSPDEFSPNFAGIFSKYDNLIGPVKSWREEPATDKHAVLWSDDIQVMSSICGERIDLQA